MVFQLRVSQQNLPNDITVGQNCYVSGSWLCNTWITHLVGVAHNNQQFKFTTVVRNHKYLDIKVVNYHCNKMLFHRYRDCKLPLLDDITNCLLVISYQLSAVEVHGDCGEAPPSRFGECILGDSHQRILWLIRGIIGYGSIPINTIFRGWTSMNPSYFDVHQGYKVLTHCQLIRPLIKPDKLGI